MIKGNNRGVKGDDECKIGGRIKGNIHKATFIKQD